jgi:hypothetical protein
VTPPCAMSAAADAGMADAAAAAAVRPATVLTAKLAAWGSL